ncbi:thermostable hemolysin [Caulobacter sp. X]|uniref:thermostable hemolysin n=1 Tax=Caulobacter sp. X TaxID=2048901 RepID=UPI001F39ED2B|nr:thermostable hemolysin [Caulobacter sp. X]
MPVEGRDEAPPGWEIALLEVTMMNDGARVGSLRFDADRVRRFTSVEPRVISIHHHFRPERKRVEAYIESTYAEAYNGTIRAHYPTLMSVQDGHGEIHAAVGFRLAGDEPLFLERYLDDPIEQALSSATGAAVQRADVAEIGNLASRSAGASLFLFMALARHLDQGGCDYAVATATRQLRRTFGRVGFLTRRLTTADPARLGEEARDWGGYYERDPEVLAGAIAPALEPLAQLLLVEPPAIPGACSRLHPQIGADQ